MSEETNTAIKHSGKGAIPSARGVTFRIWAPYAEKVYVTGTFNDWSETSTPLDREENGHWSTDVSEAKTGDEYRYLIHGPKGLLSRIDPYARKVTNSIGNGVIYDPKAFDWGDNTFHMATGNELVIYEMHVGTFNVKEEGQAGTFESAIEKFPYLKDRVGSFGFAEVMASGIQGAKLIKFEPSGHGLFYDEREKFNRELAKFVG